MFSLCVLGMLLNLSVPPAPAASDLTPGAGPLPTWLTVSDGGQRLYLAQGQYVRFQGQGHLAFGSDRRLVHIESSTPLTALVNGAEIGERHGVADDDILEVRGDDGAAWVIRRAPASEVEAVVDATRIRDAHPDRPARLDTDEPTIFFVHIDEFGGSTFVYPQLLR